MVILENKSKNIFIIFVNVGNLLFIFATYFLGFIFLYSQLKFQLST